MAAPSWSNPNPNDPTTMGAVASRFDVRAPDISGIVSAILTQRYRKQQQDRQATQDLINGIGSVAGGFEENYQSGQANDAANAALYGAQYPNDPYGAYTDPGRVPDYGGTDSLKAALLRKQLEEDPLKKQLESARLDAAQALAHNRWTYPANAGGGGNGMTSRQQVTTANDYQKATGDAFDEYGLSQGALSDQNIHAPSNTPYVYSKNAPATTVPQGQLLVVDPQTGSYQYVTQDYLNQARTALDSYKQAQQAYRGALSTGQVTQSQQGTLPPSISQNDVNQAQQALSGGTAQAMQPPQPQGAGTPSGGTVRVVAPNGQAGTIPAERLQAYLAAGYRQL